MRSSELWFGFDTENNKSGRVTLACLVGEDGTCKVWRSAGHLLPYLAKLDTACVVICHNLEYDLVNELGVKEYANLSLNYLKGRLISARCGKVRFWDSFNHFRMSLKELGKAIGLEKLEMDINSKEYVAQDARICMTAMTQARDYIASLNGEIGATSGSSGVSIWRYMTGDRFCKGAIDSKFYRDGYYGGRVEVFRPRASGNIRGYDVNSLYPFSMLNDFPLNMRSDAEFKLAKGVAKVTVDVPEMFMAPLPYRSSEKLLVYPVGRLTGTWSYDELRLAESVGAKIVKVHEAYGSDDLVRPFDHFILTLYEKRRTSENKAERLFLKVMMNSLYGKLATKSSVTRTVSRYTAIKTGREKEVRWVTYDRGMLDYRTKQPDYVNIVWGLMITAYARIAQYKWMQMAGEHKLIYTDTDSIYGLDLDLPVTDALGGLKLEKFGTEMTVIQPKVYSLDDTYVAKGVPTIRVGEDGEIRQHAKEYIEQGWTEFMAPVRFRQSVVRGGTANEWVKVKKSIRTQYKKRFSDGRFFPPVIGDSAPKQGELSLNVEEKSVKRRKKQK